MQMGIPDNLKHFLKQHPTYDDWAGTSFYMRTCSAASAAVRDDYMALSVHPHSCLRLSSARLINDGLEGQLLISIASFVTAMSGTINFTKLT